MSSVEERVQKIIAEQLSVSEDQVTSEASFVDDLGADSLDTVDSGEFYSSPIKTTADERTK